MPPPPAKWSYPHVPKMRVQGRSTVEDNFAPEKRSSLEILVREATQNPLDARRGDHDGPVEVKFRLLAKDEFDASYLDQLIDDEFVARLNASMSGRSRFHRHDKPTVLVIEDFGTIGLEGVTDDPNKDGQGQNWNAFWFREGEGAKASAGSNGRAGQGKITYYRTSSVRAIFGYTERASDSSTHLMGRSSFHRNYALVVDGEKFERDSFWCVKEDDLARPLSTSDSLQRFRDAFRLERQGTSGLSLVIPYPNGFNAHEAIRTLISDFYFPIADDRLAVTVGTLRVSRENLKEISVSHFPDDVARRMDSCFTAGYRAFLDGIIASGAPAVQARKNWWRSPSLTNLHFDDGVPANLREQLTAGRTIGVRFPLTVRPSGGSAVETFLDVYLQMPDDLEAAEEAYIRMDLLIGSETQLAKARHVPPARGLTLIRDGGLSALMADAEEPTHMKWNASRPRLAEDYESPKDVVTAVRHAMPRLLAFLASVASRRDTKALAGLFSRPTDTGLAKRNSGSKGKAAKGGGEDPGDPPAAIAKPFRWEHGETWDRVHAKALGGAGQPALPTQAAVEFAYLGVDDDAFTAYDPFDFDLAKLSEHPIEAVGCSVVARALNKVTVNIEACPFSLKVGGFDPNLRRRMRIDYKVAENVTNVLDE